MPPKLELYGFSGKLGTGKNFIAEKLFLSMMPRKNTLVTALADQIKVDCVIKDKVAFEDVFHNKTNESRRLLQTRGTDEGRAKYGPDHWSNYTGTWHRVYRERGMERIIVTDIRFKNELEWLKKAGGTAIRIEAPNRNKDQLDKESGGDQEQRDRIANHLSEIDLDDSLDQFDYVIQNDYGDEKQVANKVRDIVRELTYKKPVDLTIFCDLDDTICECGKFYRQIASEIVDDIQNRTQIDSVVLAQLADKHIFSFEQRYYTRDDFAISLVKLAVEAHLVQGKVLEITDEYKKSLYEKGMDVYNKNYEPLNSDSLEYVRKLTEMGQVVLFTLGDWTEQMKKIAYLGLTDLPVEIFTHKDENMFRFLQTKYPSETYAMIGDSYKRDIVPAKAAGIRNLFHISAPSNYDEASNNSEQTYNDYRVFQVEKLGDELLDLIKNFMC